MLSEALRLMRIYHDMKQNELATELGISTSHLSEIEKGKKQPSLELINRYSDKFRIPISSILFFAERLEDSSGSLSSVEKARGAIAGKVINFLKLVEERTSHAEKT